MSRGSGAGALSGTTTCLIAPSEDQLPRTVDYVLSGNAQSSGGCLFPHLMQGLLAADAPGTGDDFQAEMKLVIPSGSSESTSGTLTLDGIPNEVNVKFEGPPCETGTEAQVTGTATIPPSNRPPENSSPPTISGAPIQGSVLVGDKGVWYGSAPKRYAYQWQRCAADGTSCVAIGSATSPGYLVDAADVGRTLRLSVTATNAFGTATAVSAPTAVVQGLPPKNDVKPAIEGAPVEGTSLTVWRGSWSGTPTLAYAQQWFSCDSYGVCTDIAGATGTSYALTEEEVGSTIGVRVTATNAQGTATAQSDVTQTVEAPDSPPAEPGTDQDDVDDEATADDQGSWVALDAAAATAYEQGRLTLPNAIALSSTNGSPAYHCNAKITHKVGGVRELHTEGGHVEKQRTVKWTDTERCTGGAEAIYMKGYSFLNRVFNGNMSRYVDGKSYDSAPSGPVMKIAVRTSTVEGNKRKKKQIEWHANTEVPPPYQWVNDQPFGRLTGIDKEKSDCNRYPIGYPAYLSGLRCTLFSHRFR